MARLNRLSAVAVAKRTRPGFLADGGGLYLRTRKTGGKSWIFRAFIGGKPRDHVIGAVHTIPLALAREMAADARLAHREGRDIKAALQRDTGEKTCLDAFNAIVERRSGNWKSDKTHIKWRRCLMVHAKPLHHRPVTSVATADVERVLRPVWASQPHTGRMMRGMLEQAFDLATVLGWRTGDNPARWKGNLEFLLDGRKPPTRHHTALPYRDAPAFMARLLASDHPTRHALAFTILTASRGHMVRHATWGEFDLPARTWTVPVERMKRSEVAHVVPLTARMLALLPEPGAPDARVWPYRGKGFSENAFKSTLDAMGMGVTAHGFRSTFKDWAADTTDYADEVSEIALAHKVGSDVRRAYRRGKALDARRDLLTEWGDYLHAADARTSAR